MHSKFTTRNARNSFSSHIISYHSGQYGQYVANMLHFILCCLRKCHLLTWHIYFLKMRKHAIFLTSALLWTMQMMYMCVTWNVNNLINKRNLKKYVILRRNFADTFAIFFFNWMARFILCWQNEIPRRTKKINKIKNHNTYYCSYMKMFIHIVFNT